MSPPGPRTSTTRQNDEVWAGFLLIVTLLCVYWPVAWFAFINYDDPVYAGANPAVTRGLSWEGLAYSLTAVETNHWHPLTWLSHMADCSLFGTWAGGHHLVNLILFAGAVAGIYVFFSRATRQPLLAFCITAIFALHPLQVEPVAWVSARKDVLATFWLGMLLLAWLAWVRTARRRWFVTALVCFILGLLSKGTMIFAPALLMLLELWPLDRAGRRPWDRALLWEKVPFAMISLIFAVASLLVRYRESAAFPVDPPVVRILHAVYALAEYGLAVVIPWRPLALGYPFPRTLSIAWALVILVLAAIAVGMSWRELRNRPWLLMGTLWVGLTLGPFLGLLPLRETYHADRYMHWPLLGVAIILGGTLWEFTGARGRRILPGALFLLAIGGMAATTHRQVLVWRGSETLFRHGMAVDERNYLATQNLAAHLWSQGRKAEAATLWERALLLNPRSFRATMNLGTARLWQGRTLEADELLRRAQAMNPTDWETNWNLGYYLYQSGQMVEAHKYLDLVHEGSPGAQNVRDLRAGKLGGAP